MSSELVGAPAVDSVDDLVGLYASWGTRNYDEAVTQLDHALQCAAVAVRDGEPESLVAAALLHDLGHLLWMAAHDDPSVPRQDTRHEDVGADALATMFGPEVREPIRLHVAAKRVLLSTDATYAAGLSPGSTASAVRQGGPASPEEVAEFAELPFADEALRLRRIDDAGKVIGLVVEPFEHYVPMLRALASA